MNEQADYNNEAPTPWTRVIVNGHSFMIPAEPRNWARHQFKISIDLTSQVEPTPKGSEVHEFEEV